MECQCAEKYIVLLWKQCTVMYKKCEHKDINCTGFSSKSIYCSNYLHGSNIYLHTSFTFLHYYNVLVAKKKPKQTSKSCNFSEELPIKHEVPWHNGLMALILSSFSVERSKWIEVQPGLFGMCYTDDNRQHCRLHRSCFLSHRDLVPCKISVDSHQLQENGQIINTNAELSFCILQRTTNSFLLHTTAPFSCAPLTLSLSFFQLQMEAGSRRSTPAAGCLIDTTCATCGTWDDKITPV